MPSPIRHVTVAILAAILALAAGSLTTAAAQPDLLFDPAALQEVRLYLHPNDWKTLQANYLDNTYYQADFVWRNQALSAVGIRSRGNGSRNERKPGLRVDFNRFVSGQKLFGLASIILDNKAQDPSFLEEHVSMQLFARMGIPAPRESYCKLFINDQYWGLYSLVESIDKDFLKRTLGDNGGYLYEYKWTGEYYFEDLGENPESYVPLPFKPQTHEDAPDPSALVAMIRTINSASDEEFEQQAGRYFDLAQVIAYLAVESFLAETDGLTGAWAMNNFYLYQKTGSTQFVFIPWDKDSTFWDFNYPIALNTEKNVLTRRVLSIPRYAQLYIDTLRQLATEVSGPDSWLRQDALAAYQLFREAAIQDPNKPYTWEQVEGEIGWVLEILNQRGFLVLDQIEQLLNPTPPAPSEEGAL